ncbi:MAG: reverse transcriptase domain-containing protein [Granulosicoccus sp.]
MKRIGGLFDRIYLRDNLSAALWAATRNKRRTGEIDDFTSNVDERLSVISKQLRTNTYQFSGYRCFSIRDTKTRLIHAPCFADRVVHHAIIRITGPVFEQSAIANSYACVLGRGQHRAIEQVRQWAHRHQWYGKVDVRKFYDSINHAVLKRLLARRFREKRLLVLFDTLIDSWCHSPGHGIPIGALTSQWFGNFYLDEVDRVVMNTGSVPCYQRYMDDMLLMGSQEQIARARPVILSALGQLQLVAKDNGQWNRVAQGIPWLGFTIYPERMRLNSQARRRLRRKFKSLQRRFSDGRLTEREYQARASALFAHALHASDINFRRGVLVKHDSDG